MLMPPSAPTCWSGITVAFRPGVAPVGDTESTDGGGSLDGPRPGGRLVGLSSFRLSPPGGRDSGANGSIPGVVPGGNVGSGSVNSPPAALSQSNTETVSPTAILNSGGLAAAWNRCAKLSFGRERNVETTRSSTGTTSNRISPSVCPCSSTAPVEGPARGTHEHAPSQKEIRQTITADGFIGFAVVNQHGQTYHGKRKIPRLASIHAAPGQRSC